MESIALRARYVMIEARIPQGVRIDRIDVGDLPVDWRHVSATGRISLERLQSVTDSGKMRGCVMRRKQLFGFFLMC